MEIHSQGIWETGGVSATVTCENPGDSESPQAWPGVMPSSPLPTSKGPWFCHLSPRLGSMPDVSPVLSLPYQSSGITLLLQSLVCGLGLCSHQVILLFRILPLTGASPPGRAGSLSAPGPARPSSTPPPDCCSPPLQTPLLAPRGLRAKLKPDLPAARLSRRTCRSLREPPAVFRRPVLPRLPFR